MTGRTLIVLAAALVVLALVAMWGQRSDAPQTETNALFLPELETALADVDRVRVVGAGNETLATLERRPNSWVVLEKQGYPADIAKIRGALTALAEARIVEQKTANPAYYDRLGVQSVEEDTATGVELIAYAADDVRASVIVGTADAGNLQFVRASDAETSYLVDREISVPRDAVEWIDPAILDISSSRVESVTIEHPDGEVVRIAKNDASDTNYTVEGIPEGRELSYAGVANVIASTLRTLRLDDVAAADDELPEDVTRTTFRTFDGLLVTATMFEADDRQWVRFAASAAAESGGSDADTEGEAADASDASEGVDAEAEAEQINARVDGWQYQIPAYLYNQLTRRMEDLLAAESSSEEETEDDAG